QVSVNQNELVEYVVASAQQYGMDPNEFAKAVDEAGQIPAMVAEVARRKALATILENAKITDTSGQEVDLSTVLTSQDEDAEESAGEARSGEPVTAAAAPVPSTSGPASAADPAAVPTLAVTDVDPDDAKA
ncbi:MAG TPA: hypothetical protein VMT69_09220, partial [Kineosporiaceae bacterium]|nr:hypothetical protein [Kineosporiaceae bacterium]